MIKLGCGSLGFGSLGFGSMGPILPLAASVAQGPAGG